MKKLLMILILIGIASLSFAETMPDFKLQDMNNKEVTLASLLNKGPVIIDFWASWCSPCKVSMPYLDALDAKYDSLTVVMISIDAPKDISKAKSFFKSKQFNMIGLFDSDKALAKKLNVNNIPHTFIIDKTGEIVTSHVGFEPGTEREYEQTVRTLLHMESLQVQEGCDE